MVTAGLLLTVIAGSSGLARAGAKPLNVVTTTADYADVTRFLGQEHVKVINIIHGDQDPHVVRPKPSLAQSLAAADMLVATGLDLEMWLPPLVDKSGNARVRDGNKGYVAAQYGLKLLEKPVSLDRSQGDVHVYGNPHFHTNPLNMRHIAQNITIGLIKNDPSNEAFYKERLRVFQEEIDRRMFGPELVKLLGSKTLVSLAQSGNLVPFLSRKKVHGKPLIEYAGGWIKKALPLRGLKVVSYHKNWTYLARLYGIEFVAEVEPKPGIPPSAKDVADLVNTMKSENIRAIFAANYFDENKVALICEKVNARPVIVPLSVGGEEGVNSYFSLIDLWLDRLLSIPR